MSNKCVTVLAPNGRRQNVKVTPNTTILQVLEEVCQKQGFKAEEYDIKHHNKALDATAIMRFTGLPNNAQLEMVTALKTRAETRVKVGLALESGDRIMGEFEPSDSLWRVVKTLCPDEAEPDEAANILPVIIYMGREESGTENLKKTTLRSLGLTKGGAILRFFKKTPEELHRQANVSAPLSRPPTAPQESSKPSSSGKAEPQLESNLDQKQDSSTASQPSSVSEEVASASVSDTSAEFSLPPTTHALLPEKTKSGSEIEEMEYEDSSGTYSQITSPPHVSVTSNPDVPCNQLEETIIFLGERNAVLFDMGTARICKPEDVPDDFFDLTMDDAKQLLRDLKRRQAALEEQPLVTLQYRELEKSKQMLNALHHYKKCVVRIEFPNQLVLQGTFKPLEKVHHVIEFVKGFLEDPSVKFHIFTTPPKTILESEQTLYDAKCVPGAVVHFISSSPCPDHGSYLRQDIMAQVSTPTAADSAARKSRCIKSASLSSSSAVDGAPPVSLTSNLPHASTSTAASFANRPSSSIASTESNKNVPKWFKPLSK